MNGNFTLESCLNETFEEMDNLLNKTIRLSTIGPMSDDDISIAVSIMRLYNYLKEFSKKQVSCEAEINDLVWKIDRKVEAMSERYLVMDRKLDKILEKLDQA